MDYDEFVHKQEEKDLAYPISHSRLPSSTNISDNNQSYIYSSDCLDREAYHGISESLDTRKTQTTVMKSPERTQSFNTVPQSSDTLMVNTSRTVSPDTRLVMSDTCQTSQVSSSSSEYRQPGDPDVQESSWDINDPDIPARIDQHVSLMKVISK